MNQQSTQGRCFQLCLEMSDLPFKGVKGGANARVVAKRGGAKGRLCLIRKKGVSLVAAGQRGVAFDCRDNAVQ